MVAAVAISKNVEVSVAKLNKANLKKTLYYLQRNGLRETWISVRERLRQTAIFLYPVLKRNWKSRVTENGTIPLLSALWYPCTGLRRPI